MSTAPQRYTTPVRLAFGVLTPILELATKHSPEVRAYIEGLTPYQRDGLQKALNYIAQEYAAEIAKFNLPPSAAFVTPSSPANP